MLIRSRKDMEKSFSWELRVKVGVGVWSIPLGEDAKEDFNCCLTRREKERGVQGVSSYLAFPA